jgi:hypothetical protein
MSEGSAWRPDKSRLDDTDRKVLADVEQYGWHCLHIHDDGQVPFWTFTIGLVRTWSHPEIVVFGLPDTTAHEVLSDIVRRIEGGEQLESGRTYDDVFGNRVPARFVEVDPAAYSAFLGYAQWFYETEADFPVIQLVWPDKAGRFPWEAGCTVSREHQPVLTLDWPPAELF